MTKAIPPRKDKDSMQPFEKKAPSHQMSQLKSLVNQWIQGGGWIRGISHRYVPLAGR